MKNLQFMWLISYVWHSEENFIMFIYEKKPKKTKKTKITKFSKIRFLKKKKWQSLKRLNFRPIETWEVIYSASTTQWKNHSRHSCFLGLYALPRFTRDRIRFKTMANIRLYKQSINHHIFYINVDRYTTNAIECSFLLCPTHPLNIYTRSHHLS